MTPLKPRNCADNEFLHNKSGSGKFTNGNSNVHISPYACLYASTYVFSVSVENVRRRMALLSASGRVEHICCIDILADLA